MTREARFSIAIRGVSISTDVPADGSSPLHNDDSMRSAQRPKTKGRSPRRWHGALAESATGTGWERTPWHATQRAVWEAAFESGKGGRLLV
jgi:hypothetical protein